MVLQIQFTTIHSYLILRYYYRKNTTLTRKGSSCQAALTRKRTTKQIIDLQSLIPLGIIQVNHGFACIP